MSAVTTHVLDAALGRPAAGVPVELARLGRNGDGSVLLGQALTDDDGRVRELGPDALPPATYRLRFDTAAYFARADRTAFYPEVVVTFTLDGTQGPHVHVPLLLSPFAYSTYRGS